jgi:hypothetical protein
VRRIVPAGCFQLGAYRLSTGISFVHGSGPRGGARSRHPSSMAR